MTSLVMRPLARRLQRCGYRPVLLTYHSLRKTIHANARQLAGVVRGLDAARVHLVGHSLGGLVILQALQDDPGLINGRIVLLGSPVNGSVVARRLYRREWARWLVGRGAEGRLAHGGDGWQGHQQVGVIAGTLSVGVGHALGGLSGANDGTVTVAETQLAGSADTQLIHTTHTGLVYSGDVAQSVCRFLHRGSFQAC